MDSIDWGKGLTSRTLGGDSPNCRVISCELLHICLSTAAIMAYLFASVCHGRAAFTSVVGGILAVSRKRCSSRRNKLTF
jgi:hypothetical protein